MTVISASLSSGNSGGPVINNNAGIMGVSVEKRVAGITTHKEGEGITMVGDDYNFAISNSIVKKFLNNSNIKYKVFNKTKLKTFNSIQLGEILKKTSSIIMCYGR